MIPGLPVAILGVAPTPPLTLVGRYPPSNGGDYDILADTDAQIGDLVVLVGFCRFGTFSPASGWATWFDGESSGIKMGSAVRILTAVENNIQLFTGVIDGEVHAYVYRNPPGAPTLVSNTVFEGGGNPPSQTLALTAVTGPIISMAVAAAYSGFGSPDMDPMTFERAGVELDTDGLFSSAGEGACRSKHKLDLGNNPGDIVANIGDQGTGNVFQSGYIHF